MDQNSKDSLVVWAGTILGGAGVLVGLILYLLIWFYLFKESLRHHDPWARLVLMIIVFYMFIHAVIVNRCLEGYVRRRKRAIKEKWFIFMVGNVFDGLVANGLQDILAEGLVEVFPQPVQPDHRRHGRRHARRRGRHEDRVVIEIDGVSSVTQPGPAGPAHQAHQQQRRHDEAGHRIDLITTHGRTNLAKDMLAELSELGDYHVFDSIIKQTVRLGEAPLAGKPVTSYASRSQAAEAYRAAAASPGATLIDNDGPAVAPLAAMVEDSGRHKDVTRAFAATALGLLLALSAKVFFVETDPRIGLIEDALPGAQCGACGKAWMFADVPDNADIEAVGSELRHFSKFIQNYVSGASRGF